MYINEKKILAQKASAGFTLIELLVVIAIIGLLASIILASLNTARVKSRDARRVADMNQIRNAIELYNDDNKHYPNTNGTWTSFDAPSYMNNAIISPAAANLTAALSPYLPVAPKDPQRGSAVDAGYLYLGNNDNGCILFWRTPENMSNFSSGLLNPARPAPPGVNNIYMGIGSGTYADGC